MCNDIVLLPEVMISPLTREKTSVAKICLNANPGKTKYIPFNQLGNASIVAKEGDILEIDHQCLCSWDGRTYT